MDLKKVLARERAFLDLAESLLETASKEMARAAAIQARTEALFERADRIFKHICSTDGPLESLRTGDLGRGPCPVTLGTGRSRPGDGKAAHGKAAEEVTAWH